MAAARSAASAAARARTIASARTRPATATPGRRRRRATRDDDGDDSGKTKKNKDKGKVKKDKDKKKKPPKDSGDSGDSGDDTAKASDDAAGSDSSDDDERQRRRRRGQGRAPDARTSAQAKVYNERDKTSDVAFTAKPTDAVRRGHEGQVDEVSDRRGRHRLGADVEARLDDERRRRRRIRASARSICARAARRDVHQPGHARAPAARCSSRRTTTTSRPRPRRSRSAATCSTRTASSYMRRRRARVRLREASRRHLQGLDDDGDARRGFTIARRRSARGRRLRPAQHERA